MSSDTKPPLPILRF